ncbi:MAG: succinate--CoA ligase subunit alpha [Candidatus Korarchaeota archaeon]|nr:succinate--CoA ligase subunit alpha [Candidatus Korarchaeota archaeon]NIU82430.1 succinate--CoA ligase subunit alpha [Candidatus Thorarchaeota archaeon]NIW13236.1 succinate--CoA ligase subunit alpha [Candidatus Thorarchaeota archaeon]NIW51366.1 succinate--CoA ligase subunit alpha [Candidatus Korarchaeota archaeon]
MGILIDESTRILVQGITGSQGRFHSSLMKQYGSNIVCGVTPGKAGQEVEGIPVYDTIAEAKSTHEVDASIIFVPARFATEAALESVYNGLDPVVVITEHIPIHSAMEIVHQAKRKGVHVIGPNTPGIIVSRQCKMGIMPGAIFTPGKTAIVSRSGTLTYEVVSNMTKKGFGQSVAIGIGGDPIRGTDMVETMQLLENDEDTEKIVVIGEIGGAQEERTAELIKRGEITKDVVAYIAGRTAPSGKTMGHAGAIIMGGRGRLESKVKAFEEAGVPVAGLPTKVPELLEK